MAKKKSCSTIMYTHTRAGWLKGRDDNDVSISFVKAGELRWLDAVQEYVDTTIEELPMNVEDIFN